MYFKTHITYLYIQPFCTDCIIVHTRDSLVQYRKTYQFNGAVEESNEFVESFFFKSSVRNQRLLGGRPRKMKQDLNDP